MAVSFQARSAPVDADRIAQAHQLYCQLTGQSLSLGFDRERSWYELLRRGYSLEDLCAARLVVGRPGWWALVRHELVTLVAQAVPGALGLGVGGEKDEHGFIGHWDSLAWLRPRP